MKSLFREWSIPILLAVFYWWLAISATENKTTQLDEMGQITAGYSYQKYDDFRLLPEAGIFPMRWAALPLAFSQPWFPSRNDPGWGLSNYSQLGREFLFASKNDPAAILRETRSMIALLGAILGLVVYFWSKSIFGRAGATISLLLYALFPLSLTLGGYVLSDLSIGLFFSAATWAIWHSFHKLSPWTILLSAGMITGLFLSKISAALIVPMAVLLLIIRLLAGRPLRVHFRRQSEVLAWKGQAGRLFGSLLVQAVLVWLLIWCAYGFRFHALLDEDGKGEEINPNLWAFVTRGNDPVVSTIETMREAQVLPEPFLYGAARMWRLRHTSPTMARIVFVDGEYSLEGITTFFPRCVLYKTPLGTFLVLALAALALPAIWQRRKKKLGDGNSGTDILYQLTPLLVLSGVYWAAALGAPVGNDIRYLFPIYPPLFVLAGAAGYWFTGKHRLAQAAVGLGLAAAAVASFSIRPNYAAFFNSLAGGPGNGYKHLLDQDDGRELPALKQWLDANVSDREPLYVSYFGQSSPLYYKIGGYRLPTSMTLEPLPPFPKVLTGGIYCISAQNLQCNHLPIIGKWAEPYEKLYQQDLADFDPSKQKGAPAAPQAEQSEKEKEYLFQWLQFCRLCAYLRHREPDVQIDYAMLIYKLTDAEVQQALQGPPAELLPNIEVSGYPDLLR